MTAEAELDWHLGLAPEVRMALYGYQADFGELPAAVWRVPGTVTLLACGPLRLTVAAPWGAIAASGPGEDGILELIRMERPGQRERVRVADAAAGRGPAWAAARPAGRGGARLLVRSELPDGAGAGAAAAIDTAIRLCVGDPAASADGAQHASGCAGLGPQRLPCDLGAAGLRLVLVDTRVRRDPRPAPAEDAPVELAAAACADGDFTELGALMTAAHERQPGDPEQRAVVSAALRAGALGARAVTDGAGRPACLLVPARRIAHVRAEVSAELARAGARSPRFLTFTPAAGPDQPAPL